MVKEICKICGKEFDNPIGELGTPMYEQCPSCFKENYYVKPKYNSKWQGKTKYWKLYTKR